jgi:NAD(P)-dependent dehydrogenase (short-subunit alcohol dehydrogenase family)
MTGRLAGEVALVTGSTRGIGRAVATRFAAEGARVVVTGRDEARGAAVVEQITAAGGTATFVTADLSDPGAPDWLVGATLDAFGGLTVLVNNAVASDAGRDAPIGDIDPQTWTRLLAVDLTAAAMLCRAAIRPMRAAGRGSIVNVSSRAADRGTPGRAAYAASKGALNALTRSIAVDYAAAGVRCNAISPGYVLNDVRDADISDADRSRREAMHLTRLATADDIAWAAVWLASRESEVVTGIVLPVDGGSTSARAAVLG